MATEQVLFKADDKFLKEVDAAVKQGNYQSRTEFIRAALREKVDEERLKIITAKIDHIRGAAKRKITDEEYERGRAAAFQEISKQLK